MANTSRMSSNAYLWYSFLGTPSAVLCCEWTKLRWENRRYAHIYNHTRTILWNLPYALANEEAVCAAFNPIENCVMGCISLGNVFRSGTTWEGSLELRLWSSAVSVSTCSFVGTSDVSRSQMSDSTSGSPSPALPEKVGRTYLDIDGRIKWHMSWRFLNRRHIICMYQIRMGHRADKSFPTPTY